MNFRLLSELYSHLYEIREFKILNSYSNNFRLLSELYSHLLKILLEYQKKWYSFPSPIGVIFSLILRYQVPKLLALYHFRLLSELYSHLFYRIISITAIVVGIYFRLLSELYSHLFRIWWNYGKYVWNFRLLSELYSHLCC